MKDGLPASVVAAMRSEFLGRPSPRRLGPLLQAAAIGFGAGLLACALLLLLALAATDLARASDIRWPGPHPVEVLRVIDGDTVEVRFVSGPCGRGPCAGSTWRVRLRGIDTPEGRLCREGFATTSQSCAWCPDEIRLAGEAKAAAARWLRPGAAVRARDIGPDPYAGRVVARLEVISGGWQDVGRLLIATGHAVRYEPGRDRGWAKTKPWCAASAAPEGGNLAAGEGVEP